MVPNSFHHIFHLAIETTGRAGSIAVLQGEEVLEWTNLPAGRRTAASLAPQLSLTLEHCHHLGRALSLISVADGPGSFTGLRIGVTTAKTLSYGLHLPLVAVDALASIAAASFHTHPSRDSICVALDAYRGQIFTGSFQRHELLPPTAQLAADWSPHPGGVEILSSQQWQQRLAAFPADAAFAGDAKPFLGCQTEPMQRSCDAIGVGLLAIRAYQSGNTTDPLALVPRYLKASAAEEKAEAERQKSSGHF
jgi:tRNA threonylcarbamoyl adenosine modification protein YeaZ